MNLFVDRGISCSARFFARSFSRLHLSYAVPSKSTEKLQNTQSISKIVTEFSRNDVDLITRRLSLLPRYTIKNRRRAAILLPLCFENISPASYNISDDAPSISHITPSVLFTLRSSSVSTHKGQVSFPGGHVDETDKDCIECALREANEEIGIDPKEIEVLGMMGDFLSITNVAVTPIIGLIKRPIGDLNLTHNPAEIDHIFTLPLSHLADNRHFELEDIPSRGGILPVFHSSVKEHRVWGLSAMILYKFLKDVLLVPFPNASRTKKIV